jgi:aldose 1-epimerase
MTFRQNLDNGELAVEVDIDNGARISSIVFRGFECVLPFRGQLLNWGWYSMAPWAGRVRDGLIKDKSGKVHQLPTNLAPPHAIHGFTLTHPWQEIDDGVLAIDFPEPYHGARLEQRIELLDNALRWSLEYESGSCDLPFSLGFHPWFPREFDRGGSAEIEFSAGKMFERGPDYLPTGKLVTPSSGPWDDAFTEVRGTPTVSWEDAIQIQIDSDSPYWVVYDQDPEGICIEPQSAPPDAANLGIVGDSYLEALFIFEEI